MNSKKCKINSWRTFLTLFFWWLAEVPPTESTLYPGVCPDNTQGDYRERYSWLPYKSHCYLFVTDLIEWADAVSSCVRHGKWLKQFWIHLISGVFTSHHIYYSIFHVCSKGGVLASIEDPDEQKFIESNLEIFKDSHTSFWIGLYKTHRGTNTFRFQPTPGLCTLIFCNQKKMQFINSFKKKQMYFVL